MTKDEYEDFALRYKGCGACFPMYHTLSRFEKMWFSAIQKDVAELEKENAELKEGLKCAEHNCKVKQKFNDNQFNAIMKLREELTKLTDELYLSGLSEKQIAIIEQIQDLIGKGKNIITKLKQSMGNQQAKRF